MTKLLLSSCFLSLGLFGAAQNLVPNPSFDVQTTCPDVSEIEVAPPWTAPTNGTPDLFQSGCPTQNVSGRTGPGSAGVYVHGEGVFANYREYIQAPLTSPLIAGQGYCASVWVRRSNFRYATDRFGILLSNTAVSLNNTNVLPFTPQVENTPGHILDSSGWEEVSGGFVAQGGEQYITIGSFSGPDQTTVVVANESNTSTVAFYRIDDVVLIPCAVGVNERSITTFDVFPQPATQHLSVRLAHGDALRTAQLFDSRGGLVRAFTENGASELVHLDISGIASGLYHMIVNTTNGAAARTIMVEN